MAALGGALGVATARDLARRRMAVELFTEAALGSGASGRSPDLRTRVGITGRPGGRRAS